MPIAKTQSICIVPGLGQTLLYCEQTFNPMTDWVGQITTAGTFNQTPLPMTIGAGVAGLAVGRDGNIWFTQQLADTVYRMTPSGTLSLAFNKSATQPVTIVAGPDGNIWFFEQGTAVIARLTL